MSRLRSMLDGMLQRTTEGDSSESSWERISRELRGSIFTLITLFELVSLTSYLHIDSLSLFQGHLDRMNNLGGIVGAALAEWCLGSVGIMGYTLILLTAWLAVSAFRGITLRDNLFRVVGTFLTSCLASIGLFLLFSETTPEASLLHGGWIGKNAGIFLRHYFNTTGAMLLVGGGFAFTLILTTGFSITGGFKNLFSSKDEEEEAPAPKLVVTSRPLAAAQSVGAAPAPVTAAAITAPDAAKPGKKRRKSKKNEANGINPDGSPHGSPDTLGDGTGAPTADTTPSEFTFQDLIPYDGSYPEPSLRLLKSPSGGPRRLSKGEARQIAQKLVEVLLSFQITGDIVAVSQGPVLTTFEFKPSAGMKLSKIAGLQDDLGIVLGSRELRVVAPIPGKTVVGIEVPRPQAEVISLKDCLAEKEFNDKKYKIPFALGKTTDGIPVFGDVTAMPHLLVAGATGSGKSVFVNSLIMSFIFRLSPQQLRLILVDPKMLELSVFDGIPHLISNVITDNTIAYNALSWAVTEMDRRYGMMAQTNSKNIESFNSKQRGTDKLPYIVIVIDELADLMMSGGQAVEVAITRLAQKARAAGIHLVIATQRPSTDVVTGLIKANVPSRISFKVPSGIDSRTVLDTGGAEELIGRGDCLMIQPSIPLRRLHGCFVTEEELARAVKFVKGGKDHSKYYIDFRGGSIPSK